MKKIWMLMKKDLLLCPGWLMLGVALTAVMPIYIISSIELPSVLHEPILILCAICAGNVAMSRICYIEDNQAVKTFLASLPVSKKTHTFTIHCCRCDSDPPYHGSRIDGFAYGRSNGCCCFLCRYCKRNSL